MHERKDGRPLVTEHPVTPRDHIDYMTDVDLSEEGITCAMQFDHEDDEWEYDSA